MMESGESTDQIMQMHLDIQFSLFNSILEVRKEYLKVKIKGDENLKVKSKEWKVLNKLKVLWFPEVF